MAKKILVVGASSGTGLEAVKVCVERGYEVTAFARSAATMEAPAGVKRLAGDALKPEEIEAAVAGHDAVIVTLGIHENPVLVRLGIRKTPIDVRSRGTQNVIDAMQKRGVERLVVQSTYGVGDSEGRLSFGWALAFGLLLAPQIADTKVQEQAVKGSGLEWTLVQPVGLTDVPTGRPTFTSESAEAKTMQVSRRAVAEVLVDAALSEAAAERCVAVSS